MTVEVMWVTASRLRGPVPVSKVHLWGGDIRSMSRKTLCGISLPKRSRWTSADPTDPRCVKCARKAKS